MRYVRRKTGRHCLSYFEARITIAFPRLNIFFQPDQPSFEFFVLRSGRLLRPGIVYGLDYAGFTVVSHENALNLNLEMISKLLNGASLAFANYFFIAAAPSTCRE